jgi:hypothetical protein
MLRRGSASWPDLVHALRTSSELTVRAVAAETLLLLAEPASACEMAELYGLEPEPGVRRLLLQAIAATSHPAGSRFLAHLTKVEPNVELREVALHLAMASISPRPPRASTRGLDVAHLLERVERGEALPHQIDEIERLASPRDVPALERAMTRLPLLADRDWPATHARLAQARARLRCATTFDCE